MFDKRLLEEIKQFKAYKAAVVINGITAFAISFCLALCIAKLVDNIFIRQESLGAQKMWIFASFLSLTLKLLLNYIFEKVFRHTGLKIKKNIRNRIISSMLHSASINADNENSGSKAILVCEAVDFLDPYFYEYIPQLVILIIVVPLILLAAFFIDKLSFLIMLVTAPILPLFLALIGMAADQMNKSRMKSLQVLGGTFLEILNGMKTLKLFGQSKARTETIFNTSENFRKTTMEVLKVSFLSAFVLELAASISTAIIAVSLGLRLMYGRMSFLNAFLILLLAPEYYQPIRQFGAKFHLAMTAKSAVEKIWGTFLNFEVNKAEAGSAKKETVQNNLGNAQKSISVNFDTENGLNIKCIDVSFEYENSKVKALNGINLDIAPNSITALVGKSGSGKSTLASLLLRFIEFNSGEIFFNGKSIKNIDLSSLRRLIAYIPQKPFIFNDSILENIRFSKPEATLEEVRAAAKKAAADEFIMKLPNGYDTIIDEGHASVSQGEAQRIAVARAFLKDASLVIVDEATSSLDAKNEAVLINSIESLSKNRAVLIIAHRLSTVENADMIFVMDEGKIKECGKHEDLMGMGGIYSELIKTWEGEHEAV